MKICGLMYFFLFGEWNTQNRFFIPGDCIHPLKSIVQCAKACSIHCCNVKMLGKVAHMILAFFFWFLRESPKETPFMKSKQRDQFQPGKILKILEHVALST